MRAAEALCYSARFAKGTQKAEENRVGFETMIQTLPIDVTIFNRNPEFAASGGSLGPVSRIIKGSGRAAQPGRAAGSTRLKLLT